MGGFWSGPIFTPLPDAALYAPGTAQFRVAAAPTAARMNHTATVLRNGRVLVTGGWGDSQFNALDSVELYDPQANQFLPGPSLSQARAWHTATRLPNGDVLIAGGKLGRNTSQPSGTAELYTP